MKLFLTLIFLPSALWGQAPGVRIIEQSRSGMNVEQNQIIGQVEKLGKDKKLLSIKEIESALESPTPRPIKLADRRTTPLAPPEIEETIRKSAFRVGWGYLCQNCDHWHINLAGGYAVSDDGVIATCAHVIDVDNKKMREGGLIAVDQEGQVYPVTAILANHDEMDAALVKIEAKTSPLPLNDLVRPGDIAFCLSRPLNQKDYFSKGMVNRFYWDSTDRGDDDTSLKALGHLKLNVSSRWAPGSSGSPVVDLYGNAIGHVAVISRLKGSSKSKSKEVFITLHTATPARAVRALAVPAEP